MIVVCRECESRKDGPTDLRAKTVRKSFKQAFRGEHGSLRVVQSSCLGYCPKRALMVLACRAGQVMAAQVCDDAAIEEVWERLRD
ncbi:MAG TPA: hypothetical protein PKA20_03550 [Burkholderiaceae bacterium]|nr:hypothetical protein [Burkholderiaceae bacterium]